MRSTTLESSGVWVPILAPQCPSHVGELRPRGGWAGGANWAKERGAKRSRPQPHSRGPGEEGSEHLAGTERGQGGWRSEFQFFTAGVQKYGAMLFVFH